ncbi:unnamed protein product [Mesocestoides corti]|uniref:AGC-kinase C-terminal domain-containing protein n=1 Tax=Mesocestoides corti TaxID=53468 RepID=A0A0R3U4B9_MESCO|nr:unnamed protein product [Mesocestoides corti]
MASVISDRRVKDKEDQQSMKESHEIGTSPGTGDLEILNTKQSAIGKKHLHGKQMLPFYLLNKHFQEKQMFPPELDKKHLHGKQMLPFYLLNKHFQEKQMFPLELENDDYYIDDNYDDDYHGAMFPSQLDKKYFNGKQTFTFPFKEKHLH